MSSYINCTFDVVVTKELHLKQNSIKNFATSISYKYNKFH